MGADWLSLEGNQKNARRKGALSNNLAFPKPKARAFQESGLPVCFRQIGDLV